MFNNEMKSFKRKVEDEMKLFFGLTPNEVKDEITRMKNEYGKFCDMDKTTFHEVFSPEYKDILMRYKTLSYFNGIYERLLELEEFFKEGI